MITILEAHHILTRHFEWLDKGDIYSAAWQRYLAVHALCVTALHAWYNDLETFRVSMGMPPLETIRQLTLEMARGPEQYVPAASLFGEVHRFTLLRSALAIRELLEGWDVNSDETTGHPTGGVASAERKRMNQMWRSEAEQRYALTANLVDTAVKISYVGSAAGYLKEVLGGKPFLMMFEPLETALRRIRG